MKRKLSIRQNITKRRINSRKVNRKPNNSRKVNRKTKNSRKSKNKLVGGNNCSDIRTKNSCNDNVNCIWDGKLNTTGVGGEMRHGACINKPSKSDCVGRKENVCVVPCNWVKSGEGYCRPGNY